MGAFRRNAPMEHQASTTARRHAVTLRVGMTDAERRLWSRLRGEQLGVKFRRQHPLGCYVLDFVCLEAKLIIEVDGSQHLDQRAYDARRSAWLASQGFRMPRFWANAALSDTDALVSCIIDALAGAEGCASAAGPHPNPPPAGEGVRVHLSDPARTDP